MGGRRIRTLFLFEQNSSNTQSHPSWISAEVKMPSGQVDKPVIQDNRDGTVSIKYDPKEEGIHELAVKYNGEPIQGECSR